VNEDEDWLWHVASKIEIEDRVIWVYGVDEDGIMTFTDFGIENLIELIKLYKEDPQAGQALNSAKLINLRAHSRS
jgi:hypothetical protein